MTDHPAKPTDPTIAEWGDEGLAILKSWRAAKRSWALQVFVQHLPVTVVFVGVAMAFALLPYSPVRWVLGALGCLIYAIYLLLQVNFGWKKLKQATRHELDLLDDSVEGEAFAVEIAVVQDKVVTGRDRGVLWKERGRLGFHGHSTSFMLTPNVVEPEGLATSLEPSSHEAIDKRVRLNGEKICLKHPSRKLSLWVIPLDVKGDPRAEVRAKKAIADLHYGPESAAPAVYPPLDVQLDQRRRIWLTGAPVIVYALLLTLPLLYGIATNMPPSSRFILFCLLLSAAAPLYRIAKSLSVFREIDLEDDPITLTGGEEKLLDEPPLVLLEAHD